MNFSCDYEITFKSFKVFVKKKNVLKMNFHETLSGDVKMKIGIFFDHFESKEKC